MKLYIFRFKNQILCDLHFADMALMESSDFMQQLRNFKAQSLGNVCLIDNFAWLPTAGVRDLFS